MLDAATAEDELFAALGAPSTDACVTALARAWAVFPAARIGQAAVAMGAGLSAEPVSGLTQRAREARWHEVAEQSNPADLPALLATEWPKRPKDALARLEQLARFPRDPRIVQHLIELDTGERFLSGVGVRFWRAAWTLVLGWGSAEAATRLPKDAPVGSALPWAMSRWLRVHQVILGAFAGRLPTEPVLTAKMEEALAALEARAGEIDQDARALFIAVLESPSNDAPRLVLADALAQRGDPRGEFIQLQFAHERGELTLGRRERMERLLAAGGRTWFNGLLGQVTGLAVFRRGFLAEAQLGTRTPEPSARGWRTVEAVDAAGLALPLVGLLRGENLAGVRRLHHVRGETLVHLLREGAGLGFELVEVRSPTPLPASCTIECLRVRADAEEAIRWFLLSSLGTHVAALELDVARARGEGGWAARGARLATQLTRVEAEAPAIQRVELGAEAASWPRPWRGAWHASFTRGADGRFSRLEVRVGKGALEGLGELLLGLAADQLTCIEVSSAARLSPAAREALLAVLKGALEPQRRLVEARLELTRLVPRPADPVIHDGR